MLQCRSIYGSCPSLWLGLTRSCDVSMEPDKVILNNASMEIYSRTGQTRSCDVPIEPDKMIKWPTSWLIHGFLCPLLWRCGYWGWCSHCNHQDQEIHSNLWLVPDRVQDFLKFAMDAMSVKHTIISQGWSIYGQLYVVMWHWLKLTRREFCQCYLPLLLPRHGPDSSQVLQWLKFSEIVMIWWQWWHCVDLVILEKDYEHTKKSAWFSGVLRRKNAGNT